MLKFRSIQAGGLDSETSRRDLLQEHGVLEQAFGRCSNQGSAVDKENAPTVIRRLVGQSRR
jgi:hypothetical protein